MQQLKTIIFDLESTLFFSSDFKNRTYKKAVECISNKKSVSLKDAEIILDAKREMLHQNLGYKPALSKTINSLGVSLKSWAKFQNDITIDDIIEANFKISDSIARISRKYNTILYTNMCLDLTQRVLQKLELVDYFKLIITPQYLNTTKPNHEVPTYLINNHNIEIKETLSVGDRFEVDIMVFEQMGGLGFLVSSEDDIIRLKEILKA